MPSRTADQYIVRFPEGLRDKIKALAKANRRSMNAEIVFALEERMQAATGGKFGDWLPPLHQSTQVFGVPKTTELVSITTGHALTMSSLEIAGLTGKRHDNIIRDIRKMLTELNALNRGIYNVTPSILRRSPTGPNLGSLNRLTFQPVTSTPKAKPASASTFPSERR
jgi:hypothetical protein